MCMATQNSTLQDFIDAHAQGAVKLHLGCGGVRWKDFINVDLYPHHDSVHDSSRKGCVADIFADIRNLGLSEATVDEIFTSHTVEHFTRWESIDMFAQWYNILRPGGKLVIEMPDFKRCILWLFHPSKKKRELARSQFYGNQWDRLEFETHRYVWSAKEIVRVLREIGFSTIAVSHHTETHYAGRDMRIEALK